MKTSTLIIAILSFIATSSYANPFKYLKKADRPNYSKEQLDRLSYQTEAQIKAKKEMDELRDSVPYGMSFQDPMGNSKNLTEVSGVMLSKDEGKTGVLQVVINHAEQKVTKQKIPVSEASFSPTNTAITGFSESKTPDLVKYSVLREYNHNHAYARDPNSKLIENGKEVKFKSVYEVFSSEVVDGRTRRVRHLWKEETDGKLKSLSFNGRDHLGRVKKGRILEYKFTDNKGEPRFLALTVPDDLHVLDFRAQGDQVFLQGINGDGKAVYIDWDVKQGQLLAEKNRKIFVNKTDHDFFRLDVEEEGAVQVVKAGQGARGMKVEASSSNASK